MKHNQIIPIICLAALLLATLACSVTIPAAGDGVKGSGNLKTETRQVSGFQAVELSGVGDLRITQGEEESLEIEAEDNILELIETKVENNTLHIGFKPGIINIQPTDTIRYTLVVKDMNSLVASGAGSIRVGALQTESLDVDISGAGSLEIDSLEASQLDVLISGAGSGEVNGGKVDRLKLDISGAGSFRAPDMQAGTADVNISGLGSAKLWVTELLDVMLSGTGGVEYYGQPRVTQLISGLGKVEGLGDHP